MPLHPTKSLSLRQPLPRRHAALGGAALGAAGVIWATACARGGNPSGAAGATPERGQPADLVLYEAGGAVAALTVPAETRPLHVPGAVLSPDSLRLVSAAHDGETTHLTLRDPATGVVAATAALAGRLWPRVAALDGRTVALTDATGGAATGPSAPYPPPGRSETTLVLADPWGQRPPQIVRLEGNYEPEAFSLAGERLFVVQHLPALAPDRYRVRTVDLARGAVGPVLSRDKQPVAAEEEMRGRGRTPVLAPSGSVLYTLYTHHGDHLHTRDLPAAGGSGRPDPHVHAFVHVLHLQEGWAFCLDLPAPFGLAPAPAPALAVAPDGDRLFVWDGAAGALAVADTATLRLSRVAALAPGPGSGPDGPPPALAAGRDGWLFLGAGDAVRVADARSLEVRETWMLPGAVRSLLPSGDGSRLYAAFEDALAILDTRTGRMRQRLPAPGITELLRVSPLPASPR
jgi:hypothetical protein